METTHVLRDGLSLSPEQRKAVEFIAEFTRRMVVMAFTEDKTPAIALSLIEQIYRFLDDLLTGYIKSGAKLSCDQGCSWCCYLRVRVTPLEIMYLVDHLRACLPPEELLTIRQRVIRADEITRGMDGIHRLGARIPCPMLMDGKCIAYPVRPFACRFYHSLDSTECKALIDRSDGMVTVSGVIVRLNLGITAGLTEGLRTVGLQSHQIELNAGLRLLLDERASGLTDKWLTGEQAFVEAESTDAQDIELSHQKLVEGLGEAISNIKKRRKSSAL
jgi:hypothetical protein